MAHFGTRLMKWREPKIRGMLTPRNVLFIYILILVVSVPFGFIGGNGFHISTCLFGFGFMSFASLGFVLQPLFSGTLVQLRDDMIVRGARGTNSQRSEYKNINTIQFYRDCSYSWSGSTLVVNIHKRKTEGPNFTCFVIVMRNPSFGSVQQFVVPENVNVEEVVQILRDKGLNVTEGQLPS
jgi:hypothetical protein